MIVEPHINIRLWQHDWLKLPSEVRYRLTEIFEIPRSTGTVVEGNRVLTDGYTNEDLGEVTIEKMQVYLQSEETDFIKLFDAVLASLVPPPVVIAPMALIQPTISVNVNGTTYGPITEAKKEEESAEPARTARSAKGKGGQSKHHAGTK